MSHLGISDRLLALDSEAGTLILIRSSSRELLQCFSSIQTHSNQRLEYLEIQELHVMPRTNLFGNWLMVSSNS